MLIRLPSPFSGGLRAWRDRSIRIPQRSKTLLEITDGLLRDRPWESCPSLGYAHTVSLRAVDRASRAVRELWKLPACETERVRRLARAEKLRVLFAGWRQDQARAEARLCP